MWIPIRAANVIQSAAIIQRAVPRQIAYALANNKPKHSAYEMNYEQVK